MISTPEAVLQPPPAEELAARSAGRRGAFARLAPVLAVLTLAFASPSSASLQEAAQLVTQARNELAQGDGIAAEVHLKQAMDKGAAREAVAAYMGEALMAQNELDRAHDWLAPGIFTRQTTATGFRALARVEQLQGNLAAAGAAYDRVIALTPRDAELWVEIARLRYAGGEHMLALDAANYAFGVDPRNVRVLELRGQIVRDRDGLVAALPWFKAALKKAPEDVSVLAEYAATLGELGRAKEMLATTRRILELDPGNPRAFYLQAILAGRAGRFDLARRLMNRVGDEMEGMPAALLLEGVFELAAGNYVLATEALEKLVRQQPTNHNARRLLVRALFQSGEYRQLVLRFADQGARPDASPYLLTVLARSYEALGDRERAAPLLDRAAAATPAESPDDLSGAENEAETTRTAHPGNFDAQQRAGDVQLALGRVEAALERYRLAARVRLPEDLMRRMVAAHRLSGRNAEADALLQAYLAQHPRSQAAGRLAAERAVAAGDWPRARLLLDRLRVNGGGRDVRVLADLSLAQLRSGDASAAEASARAAYRLQRASPLATQAWGLSLATLGQRPNAAVSLLGKAQLLMGDTPLLAEGRAKLPGEG